MSGTGDKPILTSKEFYDAHGAQYDAQVRALNLSAAYPQLITCLRTHSGEISGKRVLDVGCGSGDLVGILCELGADACGIDVSPAQVERGVRRKRALSVASMEELPFPDESFDAVVSYHSFNNAPFDRHISVLKEQYRVLKRRGAIVLGAFHTPSPCKEPVQIAMFGDTLKLYPRTSDELAELFLASGFTAPYCSSHFYSPELAEQEAAKSRGEDASQVRALIMGRPYVLIACAYKE